MCQHVSPQCLSKGVLESRHHHRLLLLSVTRSSVAHRGKRDAFFDCLMVLVRRAELSVLFGLILEDLDSVFTVLIIKRGVKPRCGP